MAKKEKKEKKNKKMFLSSTVSEMKQMRWPTGKEVLKYSITTIFLCLFFIGFFVLINLLASFVKGLFI